MLIQFCRSLNREQYHRKNFFPKPHIKITFRNVTKFNFIFSYIFQSFTTVQSNTSNYRKTIFEVSTMKHFKAYVWKRSNLSTIKFKYFQINHSGKFEWNVCASRMTIFTFDSKWILYCILRNISIRDRIRPWMRSDKRNVTWQMHMNSQWLHFPYPHRKGA